jgi:hypothetical protein
MENMFKHYEITFDVTANIDEIALMKMVQHLATEVNTVCQVNAWKVTEHTV